MEATSKPLPLCFGIVVRTLREAEGWTQEELALRAKIYPNQISLLERGKRNSTLPTLERVAQALGVRCHELLFMAEMLKLREEREREST